MSKNRTLAVSKKLEMVKGPIRETGNSFLDGITVPADAPVAKEMEVVSRWPRVKPHQLDENLRYRGKLVRIDKFEHPAKKGEEAKVSNILEIIGEGQKVGIGLYSTAVLDNALQITRTKDGVTSPALGKVIEIQRLKDKIPSKQGQAAHNFIVAVGK